MNEINYMGKCPKHIERESLILYFVYVFDYTWNLEAFRDIEDVGGFFEDSLEDLIDEKDVTDAQIWWGLCLILLRHMAQHGKLTYVEETLGLVINKFFDYSESELEEYVNVLESSMHTELVELLVVRPNEFINLQVKLSDEDFGAISILENKQLFISALKKNLKQKDIKKELMDDVSYLRWSEIRLFASYWEVFLEIYIGFFLSYVSAAKIIVSAENQNLEKDMITMSEIIFNTVLEDINKSKSISTEFGKLIFSIIGK